MSLEIFGQSTTGKITGKVTDKKNGETLIGLNVKVVGAPKGASTDVEGRYTLGNLAAGKYSVHFTYVGYATKTVSDVIVKAGAVTNLDVTMDEGASNQLQAVVINVSAKQESVAGLYAQQKNAVSMSSGVSADVIKRSPDRNTGEVLKRVSGASIQDNKFIIVRGLSDRYNNAMVNNAPLPSTEPDRKTFSFDVIPSSLVDNIVINKTATPELPGDFTGGAIQIKTKDFPDVKNLEINYGIGYNSLTTFNNFYGNTRPGLDFTGFGATSRALPSSFPATRRQFNSASLNQQVAYSKGFDNTWGINNLGKAMPSQNLQFVYGNSYALKNESKLGLILSATYRNSTTISEESRSEFNLRSNNVSVPFYQFNDTYYAFNTTLGILANLSYIKGNNKFAFKNIFNKSFDDTYLNRSGQTNEQLTLLKGSQQEVNDKSLINSVLEGDHLLSSINKSRINWNVSFGRVTNNQPDLRRLSYTKPVEGDPSEPYQAAVPLVASPSTAGRFFSELSENIFGAAVNYSIPFNWLENSHSLKVGLSKQYKLRDVSARVLGYKQGGSGYTLLTLPQDQLFVSNNISADLFFIDDITNTNNKYDATGDLNAGYVMFNNVLFKKLKASWGARVENYIEELNTVDNNRQLNVKNNYLDILPSANLSYPLNDKSNLRISYSNTIARAQFRELAPFNFYDFVTDAMRTGNDDLKRSKITNLDLRYEIYPSAGQLLSISGFYKFLKDPIESFITSDSSPTNKTISYFNAPQATALGLELELRHDLGFINTGSANWKNLIFSANAAIIKSEVDFEGSGVVAQSRPLQGQSPYLINTGLHYNTPNSSWQTSLLYNRIGKRISVVGFGNTRNGSYFADYPDVYEAPRNILDFQLSKRIIKKKGEVKLNVSNIFDSDAKFYQDLNENDRYDNSSDQLINSVQYGRSVSLSFGYRF
nr:TonB-dependent receptor [Pedobacter xinjiangensis]